jgi:hypothetical protein
MSLRMNRVSRRVLLSLGLVCGLLIGSAVAAEAEKPAAPKPAAGPADDGPLIQMAILLDHSGSMSGLLNQAREHLWKVVNEFATLRRDGKPPRLEVALYKYGEAGPEQLVVLTDDLDKVSEALFAIQIAGGDEYCGAVIQAATRELKWSPNERDMKCIFIAGNEPFTQGPVDYRQACQEAIKKGITVSTIHCGAEQEGIAGMWKDGALLADGTFLTIDQDRVVAAIDAPQDKEITQLNEKLNTTYIAFGNETMRQKAAENQVAQDNNAAGLNNAALASRVLTKAGANYHCAWDLVDACKRGTIKIEDVKKEDLPKELQKLTKDELKAHVAKKEAERVKIQEQIKELSAERDAYVAKERQKLAAANPNDTLDAALIDSVQTQAKRQGYTVEK